MEQSASVSLLAACSVGVLPVVANDPALVAVYAIPMGVAQLVSRVASTMTNIFIITCDCTLLVAASQGDWAQSN